MNEGRYAPREVNNNDGYEKKAGTMTWVWMINRSRIAK